MKLKGVLLIVGVVFLAINVVVIVANNEFLAPYVGVDDVVASPQNYFNRDVQVKGTLVEGSVKVSGETLLFAISGSRHMLNVSYQGNAPSNFVAGNEVVAQGRLTSVNTFLSHSILTKCPSKYDQG